MGLPAHIVEKLKTTFRIEYQSPPKAGWISYFQVVSLQSDRSDGCVADGMKALTGTQTKIWSGELLKHSELRCV
jgi:hypothetical protein